MRKFMLVVLTVFAFASCATAAKMHKAGDYTLALPAEYEYHSAESMNAEAGCVGVFVDPAKNLPELWVYSFAKDGRDLKDFAAEKYAEFKAEKEIAFHDHTVGGKVLKCAVLEFDENWYDTKYYNYYHIIEMKDGTFLCLDFACNPEKDSKNSFKSVEKVLEQISK